MYNVKMTSKLCWVPKWWFFFSACLKSFADHRIYFFFLLEIKRRLLSYIYTCSSLQTQCTQHRVRHNCLHQHLHPHLSGKSLFSSTGSRETFPRKCMYICDKTQNRAVGETHKTDRWLQQPGAKLVTDHSKALVPTHLWGLLMERLGCGRRLNLCSVLAAWCTIRKEWCEWSGRMSP